MLMIRRHRGVTLVEMMVGMVVSIIVLWGISAVYVNTSSTSRVTSAANQLNQDMRTVMDIMVNDIRRSGYWGASSSGANPFTEPARIPQISTSTSCILYSYDAIFAGGTSGVVDPAIPTSTAFMDFFGFRLSGGALQTLLPTGTLVSTDPATTCATDALWENLTDPRSITVSALTFDTVGSKCIAYIGSTYNPLVVNTYIFWETTTAGSIGNACDATPPVGSSVSKLTHTYVETRRININLKARSNVDTTLTKTLIGTVLVRNNRVQAP